MDADGSPTKCAAETGAVATPQKDAGIITTIADSASGYAAYSLMPADSAVLSVEFKVNLLRPASGLEFLARADVIKPGKTLTVVKADVFSVIADTGDRILIASMLGTMFCVRNAKATEV